MPMQPGVGGRSPSDLPLLDLSQAEIERLERQVAEIEDVLPLTPLQEGLLFHALYDAAAPDVYTVQLDLALDGALDADRLVAAVQALVARHANLRAASGMTGWGAGSGDRAAGVGAVAADRSVDAGLKRSATRGLRHLLRQDRLQRFDLAPAAAAAVCADPACGAIGTGWC